MLKRSLKNHLIAGPGIIKILGDQKMSEAVLKAGLTVVRLSGL